MRLRRYVSVEKSISIVSFGGACRVLHAHDTAASSLADDCFAVLGGSATMPLRRYVPLEKFISILKLAGFFLILSRWSGRLILRRFFKAWGGSSLVVVRSRDRATPPTCEVRERLPDNEHEHRIQVQPRPRRDRSTSPTRSSWPSSSRRVQAPSRPMR